MKSLLRTGGSRFGAAIWPMDRILVLPVSFLICYCLTAWQRLLSCRKTRAVGVNAKLGFSLTNHREQVDSGAHAAYNIRRYQACNRPRGDVGMINESGIMLADKGRGKEWKWRLFAVNNASDDQAANTIMVARRITEVDMCALHSGERSSIRVENIR